MEQFNEKIKVVVEGLMVDSCPDLRYISIITSSERNSEKLIRADKDRYFAGDRFCTGICHKVSGIKGCPCLENEKLAIERRDEIMDLYEENRKKTI